MKRHWLATVLLLAVVVMLVAAAWDTVAIVSRPLWPWLAWMNP